MDSDSVVQAKALRDLLREVVNWLKYTTIQQPILLKRCQLVPLIFLTFLGSTFHPSSQGLRSEAGPEGLGFPISKTTCRNAAAAHV